MGFKEGWNRLMGKEGEIKKPETRVVVPVTETGKGIGQIFYAESVERLGKLMERINQEEETAKTDLLKGQVIEIRKLLDDYRKEAMAYEDFVNGLEKRQIMKTTRFDSREKEGKLELLKNRRSKIDARIKAFENSLHLSLDTEIVTEELPGYEVVKSEVRSVPGSTKLAERMDKPSQAVNDGDSGVNKQAA